MCTLWLVIIIIYLFILLLYFKIKMFAITPTKADVKNKNPLKFTNYQSNMSLETHICHYVVSLDNFVNYFNNRYCLLFATDLLENWMLQDCRPNVNLAFDFHFYRYDLLDAYSKPLKHRNTYNRSRRIGNTLYAYAYNTKKKKRPNQ